MAEPFRLRISATAEDHVVAVSGDVDMASAPTLAEALLQFGDGDVIADLTNVTFIDTGWKFRKQRPSVLLSK